MGIASVVQGIAVIAWLAALGALGLVVFNSARGRKMGGSPALVAGIAVVALLLSTAAAGLVFIEPEERGVVISALQPAGYRQQTLNPGLHWIIPVAERVVTYPISRVTYTMSSNASEGGAAGDEAIRARTNDGQEVFIDASVIYAVNPEQIVNLHITWQDRYEDSVVRPLARGIIRDKASQYGVQQIVSANRAELEEVISQELTSRMAENNLVLIDFLVRNIAFTEQYSEAVEQKQIAEQQAQQAAFVVEQRRQEAEQARVTAQGQADAAIIAAEGRAQATVLQAEAEAAALRLIAEALDENPDVLTFRYIDKLAPNVQVIYLPSGQQYLIPLPTATAPEPVNIVPTPTAPVTDTTTTP